MQIDFLKNILVKKMDFKGKKLLFLDGSGLAMNAVKRAQELGIHTIVANFYDADRSPAKKICDECWDVNFSDVDLMVEKIKENGVSGIFVGWTDSHLPFYAEICKRAGIPCCGTAEQFHILSNDKNVFKEHCFKYGVPVAKEYPLTIDFWQEDLDRISYPVMVKPPDGSGSRGVKRCDNEEELKAHYRKLYESSSNKDILCEEYIDSDKEIYIHFIVKDGEPHIAAAFMKQKAITEGKAASSAILHVFPSSYIDLFKKTAEPAVIKMIKGLGIKYGPVMFQGFIKDDRFIFYESGLRMGGEQYYVFTREMTGVSMLDLMIEFSITGRMDSADGLDLDTYAFSKTCCNYYITLKAGTIAGISGLDEVMNMPQVLQIATFHKTGDIISETNSLDRVIYRLHVMDDTPEKLAHILEKISGTLLVTSESGEDMQIEKLTYDRALEMIKNS